MSKTNKPKRTSSSGRIILIILLLTILVTCVIFGAIFFEPEKPRVSTTDESTHLGINSQINFEIHDNRSGLRSVEVSVKQNNALTTLYQQAFPRTNMLTEIGPAQHQGSTPLEPKKHQLLDGPAELIITATDYSWNGFFSGNKTTFVRQITIDTNSPKILPRHTQRYIQPGGSGIAIYSLSEPSSKHGVKLHDHFFPGFPLAGKDGLYIVYFTLDWDAESTGPAQIVAYDLAGNEGKTMFSMILKKTNQKFDNINIGDDFLQNKMPEFEQYYPEMKGTDLDKYLYINNTVRKMNSEAIKTICSKPGPERLWDGRFLRMSGASRAGFADQRTYYYQGKAIDKQTHLGMDIASTSAAEIHAANRGIVIFADYLGIYGNMVVMDHGQGIFSLYSHLSSIDVAVGDMVDKDGLLGHTGATGMAGGDHLHFSMLIHGIFTTPLEWWDASWIQVNINDVIADGLL
ncbi:MAG: M23 family metallopeptidase [Desulfobulbaceae bacterium]|nr:M23 family metallopeptidase [Desulfobulbaceae bacterium]